MMELDIKPVEYFGHTITVLPWVQWLAVNEENELCGYASEPHVEAHYWLDTSSFDTTYICVVKLHGISWFNTKAKV